MTQKLTVQVFGIITKLDLNIERQFGTQGGVSVLVKDELRPGIKVAQNTEGFIWLKLDKNFFSFLNDVFLCAAYIPQKIPLRMSI